jgi:hypothetical protein
VDVVVVLRRIPCIVLMTVLVKVYFGYTVPAYSVCVSVLIGRSMLLCVRHGRCGDETTDDGLCCFQLKIGRKVGGRLASGVISYVHLGDGCVLEMRGLLFAVRRLH